MKFLLKTNTESGRLGIIKNIERLPNFQIETPNAFLYTQGGTIPHMSHEVLQRVSTQNLGLNIPISNIPDLQERLKISKFSIGEFIGMKEYLTYCTFINPGEKRVTGFHEKNKISLWSRKGRKTYSADSYMEYIENLKPDLFLVLADGDTDFQSSKKRIKKAFDNSIFFFEKCMELYEKSETLKSSQIVGALEGGFDLTIREKCSNIIGESSVFGVVIDGLHDCSEIVCEIKSENITQQIDASLKHIPNDKLRIIHGCWNPSVVLDLIELGIDMFDSSYPYFITEQAGALIFPNTKNILEFDELNIAVENTQIISKRTNCISDRVVKSPTKKSEEPVSKRIKLITKSKYHISMLNPNYITDFTPILKNCSCYTCKNHTKAYVYHLLTVEEMLGSTLLMIHNLHHYLMFLSTIRNTLNSGKFQELKICFQKWVDKMNMPSLPF